MTTTENTAPTSAADDETISALTDLAKQFPAPDPGLLGILLGEVDEAALIARGASIDTGRIITDTTRLYHKAYEFWQVATPAQRRLLRGFSLKLLGLAVHQALALETLRQHHAAGAQVAKVGRAVHDVTLEKQLEDGLTLRDQAATALRDAVGRNDVLRQAVDATVGTAETPDALARGLAGLATLLSDWLTADNGALMARLELANLDQGYADELEAAAQAVRTNAAAAQVRSRPVTQGELDRQDGLNLELLGQIIRAFEHAHDRDPAIPRLVPIATRRMFNRKNRTGRKTTPDSSGSTTLS